MMNIYSLVVNQIILLTYHHYLLSNMSSSRHTITTVKTTFVQLCAYHNKFDNYDHIMDLLNM